MGLQLLKKPRCDKCTKIQFKDELFIGKSFIAVTKPEVALFLLLQEELVEALLEPVEDDLLSLPHCSFSSLCCHFLTLICSFVSCPSGHAEKGLKSKALSTGDGKLQHRHGDK